MKRPTTINVYSYQDNINLYSLVNNKFPIIAVNTITLNTIPIVENIEINLNLRGFSSVRISLIKFSKKQLLCQELSY